MAAIDAFPDAREAAEVLSGRLGPPALGIVLGSGFLALRDAIGPVREVPGFRAGVAGPIAASVSGADLPQGRAWIFGPRLHLYQGFSARQVAFPAAILAAAGASSILLTCAAGGLHADDEPGDFAIVTDHINLTGSDPLREIPEPLRQPRFQDLQGVYDPGTRGVWEEAARARGIRLRHGVLAALAGPSYETPAEIRMLRVLGADLVSMSTVPEAILSRYLGLRVAAIACVANRGAGMDEAAGIGHDRVLAVVERAVASTREFLREGISGMLARAGGEAT
jgi:inosine/guanosine/xanthosine phosphorylase family protein